VVLLPAADLPIRQTLDLDLPIRLTLDLLTRLTRDLPMRLHQELHLDVQCQAVVLLPIRLLLHCDQRPFSLRLRCR
jgi:hypothetical protein